MAWAIDVGAEPGLAHLVLVEVARRSVLLFSPQSKFTNWGVQGQRPADLSPQLLGPWCEPLG